VEAPILQNLELIAQGKVRDIYSVDRYNRVLAKLILDGNDVNFLQVSSGYAWHFKRYQKQQSPSDRELYSQAELNAKKNKLGLWEEKKPIAPWKWRKIKK
jgi:endonuclease YncB( thermonuclease family)